MENMVSRMGGFGHPVKHWWLTLLLGLVVFVIGLLIFGYPGVSYVGMSLVFGLVILFSGILQLFFAVYAPENMGRGWLIAGGVIELILGFILALHPAISAATLPFFLGFWLLFRGLNLIGLASDIRALKIPGSGWTIFTAILLIICAFIILISPLSYGVGAVVIWVGASFLVAGISLISFSFQLRKMKDEL